MCVCASHVRALATFETIAPCERERESQTVRQTLETKLRLCERAQCGWEEAQAVWEKKKTEWKQARTEGTQMM